MWQSWVQKEFGWSASEGMGEYEQLLMDCRFLGAVIVEGRPVGVLFSTGRLGGGGLSRGSLIWGGGLFGVMSWKWEFSFQMCTYGSIVVVMRSECCIW